MDSELQKNVSSATASDPCVDTKGLNDTYVMLTLFVDDILRSGPSMKILQAVQDTLKAKFSISDLGPVSITLGIEITRDTERGTMKLSQRNYVASLPQRFNMDTCNPVHTPGVSNNTVVPDTEEHLLD